MNNDAIARHAFDDRIDFVKGEGRAVAAVAGKAAGAESDHARRRARACRECANSWPIGPSRW